jgi:hypothetical protein
MTKTKPFRARSTEQPSGRLDPNCSMGFHFGRDEQRFGIAGVKCATCEVWFPKDETEEKA